ncbi:Membrane protein involved in the export of O-antigen and teichoic acid [Lachnospiraceae bacterium NLAE-zl-G231]|nr:Membrane protein involved in the export of O-antigen and teichoic acid [Lachnospiraceae bacterium NLAE-zl-G231]
MNIYKKLSQDTIIFAISNFSSKLLIFLLLPLYTNCLSTREYGIIDLINNLISVLFPILSLSLIESILRFSFDKDVEKNDVLNIALFSIVLSITILLLFSPIILKINPSLRTYWISFLFLYLGYSLTTTLSYYLRGTDEVKYVAFQGILQTVIIAISNMIVLLIFKWGINGYIFSLIFSYFGTCFITFIKAKVYRNFKTFRLNTNLLSSMLHYSIPLIPSKIAWWINNSIDKYFIIGLIGVGASGLYSVAHKIPSILTVLTEIFNQAWQLSAIEVYENGEDKSEFYSKVHKYYITFAIICSSFIILFSKLLGKIFFSGDFFIAWKFVPSLVIAAVFSSISGYYHSIFRAAKMTKILAITVFAGAISNFILNTIMIPICGTIGAAYATMVSFFIEWLVAYYFANKTISLDIDKTKIVISFSIVLIETIVMKFDSSIKYIGASICILLLIIINYKNIKDILGKFFVVIRRKIVKN